MTFGATLRDQLAQLSSGWVRSIIGLAAREEPVNTLLRVRRQSFVLEEIQAMHREA
jgi:hypothetical protein